MSQTFKKIVDKDILFDFLEKICDKNEKFYTFDINAYKRAELLDIITEFTEMIKKLGESRKPKKLGIIEIDYNLINHKNHQEHIIPL